MSNRWVILLLMLFAATGCTKNKKANSPAQGTGGPNYSGTGCAENCGRDASCFSSCQSVNNQTMLPPGVAPLGSGR